MGGRQGGWGEGREESILEPHNHLIISIHLDSYRCFPQEETIPCKETRISGIKLPSGNKSLIFSGSLYFNFGGEFLFRLVEKSKLV